MTSRIGVQKSHLIQNDRRPKEAVGRNCLQICEICHRKERLNLFCVASRATAGPEDEAVERQICVSIRNAFGDVKFLFWEAFEQPRDECLSEMKRQCWTRWYSKS